MPPTPSAPLPRGESLEPARALSFLLGVAALPPATPSITGLGSRRRPACQPRLAMLDIPARIGNFAIRADEFSGVARAPKNPTCCCAHDSRDAPASSRSIALGTVAESTRRFPLLVDP